ncbi:hypothetical protein K505DRAFT_369778 [Melanomma pulvis-pyrius CBS 109.77]|uniref:Uncharacterized protein n=1 Tax=Melanomma pulvis-pyrius CBS 109.77 TaxID=1314802 RepID=A0A6A6XZM4_9PLEO|nr:hypothetical protein K505DRAFT_369778 [Melanomma pulvis-pyrius CBS 109.77]
MESPCPIKPLEPDFVRFSRLLHSLASLARQSYTLTVPPSRKTTLGARYLTLCPKINAFFLENSDFDFLVDGTYGYCLEMQSLALLVELEFRWIGMGRQEVAWPHAKMSEEEEMKMKKEVFKEVDGLAFGKEEVAFRRGRWMVGREDKNGDKAGYNNARLEEASLDDASSVDGEAVRIGFGKVDLKFGCTRKIGLGPGN